MLNVNDIIVRIAELADQKKWSLYRLCKESNINYSDMAKFMRGDKMISLNNLQRICKAFDISLSQFFDSKDPCNIKLKDWRIFEKYQQLDDNYKDSVEQVIDVLLKYQEEKKEYQNE